MFHRSPSLIDGAGEGSVRPIDPLNAGQTMESALEMRPRIARIYDSQRAVEGYCRTLAQGLFRDPPEPRDSA